MSEASRRAKVPGGRKETRRAPEGGWLGAGAAALVVAAAGCGASDPVEALSLSVAPAEVARCEAAQVRFEASRPSRFALSHGERVLALGVTEGGEELVSLAAAELAPEARQLKLVLMADDGSRTIAVADLALDDGRAAPTARPRLLDAPVPGAVVALDGSASDDPEGEALTFEWRLLDATAGASLAPDGPGAALTLPAAAATVRVALRVVDPSGAADETVLEVRSESGAGNAPPEMALPSPFDQLSVEPGDVVDLAVDARDPEGAPVQVSARQVAGPPVDLEVADGGSALRFEAPQRRSVVGLLVEASDGLDATASRVTVAVSGPWGDEPPLPGIGVDPAVASSFGLVALDARATVDADSEDLSFEWALEGAPVGSLLGPESLRRFTGPGAVEATLRPDLPGRYVVRLRAADGMGFGPVSARATFTATLPARRLGDGPVEALSCAGSSVAFRGGGTAGVVDPSGAAATIGPVEVTAIAWDGTGLWAGRPGPAVVRYRRSGDRFDEVGQVSLPAGPSQVTAIACDPAAARAGDLYVGTERGTAILDASDRSCGVSMGCWVGSASTGYVHSPPSLTSHSSSRVDVVDVTTDDAGATVLHIGNEYWLARLERRGEDYDFLQAVIDLFSDGEPGQVTAIAAAPTALYVGIEGLGLVAREAERDCSPSPGAPRRCEGPTGVCHGPASSPSPSTIVALAASPRGVFVATPSSVLLYAPDEARFAPVVPDGEPLTGAPTALAACGGALYVGTDQGLWVVDPWEAG